MLVTLVIIMLTCLPVWLAVVSTELSLVVEIVILVLIDFIGLLAKILLVSCLKKKRANWKIVRNVCQSGLKTGGKCTYFCLVVNLTS